MKDLESYEIDKQSTDSVDEQSGTSPGGDRRLIFAGIAIAVVLAVAVAVWLSLRAPRTTEEEGQAGEQAAPEAATQPASEVAGDEEQIELPELGASDAVVRQMAATLSANPEVASWLVGEGLIRRFAVVVANISEGESPRPHLRFMVPPGTFRAATKTDGLVIDPDSYDRFDTIVTAFLSLDVEGSVELYRRFEPLLDQAYRELGYPSGSFETALREAAAVILATPTIDGPVELEPSVRSYHFADERLENLDPVEKQLIRIGPENLDALKAKVRAFLEVLDESAA